MRKYISCIMLIITMCICVSTPAQADTLNLDCKGAILLDAATGQVLYEQNSDVQCFPASVTKLMTMTLIMEAINNGTISPDDTVTVSQEAADMGGSQVYLYTGEQRSVREMMIAIAVGSGNDAAYAMAEFVGGTYDNFINMMNQRAAELGMSSTHFVNPHGLHDEEHYTTAADMGKLALHAVHIPGLLDYTSIYEYEFRPEPNQLILWSTNRLLKWYKGTDGLKTGYTEEAGRNLVATVNRDGMRLISVVLGCSQRQGHFTQSMNLLNYGYNSFKYESIYTANTVLATVPVSKGAVDNVNLIAARDVGYVCNKNETATISEQLSIPETLSAPLRAGDIGGVLTIYKDGTELMSIDLLVETDVPKGGFWRTWLKLIKQIW